MFRMVVRRFLCQLVAAFCAHACVFLFPTTTSALNCFKPGGLFINTGFVYKHCVSAYRAFSVLSLLDLLVVFYVYYMIINSCLLVLYVLLVVCLFVFIFFKVVMSRGSGGGGGGQKSWLDVPRPSPPPHPSSTSTAPLTPNHEITGIHGASAYGKHNVMWPVVYKHLALFINKGVVHKHRVYFCGICRQRPHKTRCADSEFILIQMLAYFGL